MSFRKYISIAAGIAKLIRFPNLIILALSQWMIIQYVFPVEKRNSISLLEIITLLVCTVFTGAAGYIINDYYDIKIDWINKPQRVVISRYIKRRFALFMHVAFNFFALGLSISLGWKAAISITLTELFLWWYSNDLKRTFLWGNILVSALSAYALLLPGIVFNALNTPLVFMAIFAFLISLIREMIKDIEDMEGDARYGCSTVAIRWGIPKIKKLSLSLLFLLGLGIFYFCKLYYEIELLYYCALVLLPLLLFLSIKTWTARNTQDFKYISTLCKMVMLAGLALVWWTGSL